MRTLSFSGLVLSFILGCGGSTATPASTPPAIVVAPTTADASGNAGHVASEPAPIIEAGPPDPFAHLPKSLPIPEPGGKPAKVKRSGAYWPFHEWTRAEVVISNWEPYGPQTRWHAYDDGGWSPSVKYRMSLGRNDAAAALTIVQKQHGELLVSKCPAPRHSVVLFDGDDPVASIDVCFTCGDVLLWPSWPGGTPTVAQSRMMEKASRDFGPIWEEFFIKRLNFPLYDDPQFPKR